MRTLRFLLRKEFKQIFRNKSIVVMVIIMPIIQLILLPLAANYEIRNINLTVVDHDHSTYAQQLISKITGSGYFRLVGYKPSFNHALQQVETDEADLVLEIPAGFEKNLVREGKQQLFIAVNAINGSKAGLGGSYLASIVQEYNKDIQTRLVSTSRYPAQTTIETTVSNWYNPLMDYHLFMVPGILAVLVTMVGGFLSALNIVKEKEIGTIEQINVTPIRKHHFILGKLIPFWILGIVVVGLGLIVARVAYGIVPVGSLFLLFAFVALYLPAVLGLGLLVSTYCDTQQQAMFIMFFFLMVCILLGGLFTPTDSMPGWAKMIVALNPLSYLISVMRMIILKGSGLKDVLTQLGIIALFGLILNTWAILNYKKTS
jgi:ABC-2 type transport system permease protein